MDKRLTIKDIARMSGVGKSTVSRVINGESGVSPETREKVLQIVSEHRFSPSKSARSMRGYSDKVVAIIVSRLDSPSENQAVRAMLPLFCQQGFDPVVMESQFAPERVEEHLRILTERNIDGVILFGFSGLKPELLRPWQDKMVIIARKIPGMSSVCYDDAGAVRLLMNQLLAKDLQHISFIGVDASDATTGQLRTQAYQNACREKGLTPCLALGNLGYQSGFDLLPQVLKPETQAVICASDTIALGAQKYLQQHNLAVEVCCIGSNPLLSFLFPETRLAGLGYSSSGEAAARLLLAQLAGNSTVQQLVIPLQQSNPRPW